MSFSDLKDYVNPSYEGLAEGQKVLAKSSEGQLWEYAKIDMVSANGEEVVIRFPNKQVENFPVQSIFPFEKESEEEFKIHLDFDNDNDIILKIDPMADKLGAWEAHTRGIGSKLMAKMGYVFGSGLGKVSEGRVEPVPIISYPRGISLDFCQTHQQKALSPTINIKKKVQKKETNMFDLVNQACASSPTISKDNSSKETLKDTNDSLQVQGFKLSQRIGNVGNVKLLSI